MVLFLALFSLIEQKAGGTTQQQSIRFLGPFFIGFAVIPGLIAFYTFYSYLYNRFLLKKRLVFLCLSGMAVSVICAMLGELILSFLFGSIVNIDGHVRSGIMFEHLKPLEIVGFGIFMTFNALVNGIIGLVMKGFITSYGDISLKEELNRKNYEMELALIKSQINPHFLFNTINNIDVLIEKDAQTASIYLNKLSDIIRFMLYETKTEKILLSKELTYLEKYIDLQKIRTANPNYVSYSIEGDSGSLTIAPMIFIPFIENAFKHSENKKIENGINIRVSILGNVITFECENKYSQTPQTAPGPNGLGNALIQKRLNLLYPDKHNLIVSNKNGIYKVSLTLFND
jgi:sensor histidine kinase YesM